MTEVKGLLEAAEEMRHQFLSAHRACPTEESARKLAEIEADIASLENALELVGMREAAGARERAAGTLDIYGSRAAVSGSFSIA